MYLCTCSVTYSYRICKWRPKKIDVTTKIILWVGLFPLISMVATQHPTSTVAEPRVQTEIQVLLSTKAPYIRASDEENAKRPKLGQIS
jgi:hypothetical protein